MPHLIVFFEIEVPLWERLLIAGTGPAVTALLGGLIIWALTSKIQQDRMDAEAKRQERRADDVRSQDLARADDAIRHELVTSMTEAAGGLYLMTQHYWRARRSLGAAPEDAQMAQQLRATLDASYLNSRKAGEVVENRLHGYFVNSDPRDRWHTVMDLLTVRYFQLVDQATEQLYENNAGDQHSGLTVTQLKNPKLLLDQYPVALKQAVESIFSTSLRARS